jgi:ATP-dependent Clp protease ATP-binding subunit ClpB
MQPVNVDEPDIESAIAIMRGLKRRYEAHHGVTLQDQALVAAVKLAKRYITGRKLPDSSIDLVDEACANIRVQLDSKPEALDKLERRRLQLQIEAKALESEKDPMSRTRLERVREELAGLEERLRGLELKYRAEKDRVAAVTEAKRRIDQLQQELETARQALDLEKAARLQYGDIPEAQKRLAQLELEAAGGGSASALALPPGSATAGVEGVAAAAGGPASGDDFKLVSDVVGPDEIAEVVARWTGIPVTKVGRWLLFPAASH